jgi:hypothetical protein
MVLYSNKREIMAIDLFEHNKTAYEATIRVLADRNKTAVIHPSEIGKSFYRADRKTAKYRNEV